MFNSMIFYYITDTLVFNIYMLKRGWQMKQKKAKNFLFIYSSIV